MDVQIPEEDLRDTAGAAFCLGVTSLDARSECPGPFSDFARWDVASGTAGFEGSNEGDKRESLNRP